MNRRWRVAALLLLMLPITCYAAQNGGYIRLNMRYDGHPVSGGSVTLYDVSDSPEGVDSLEMLVYVRELGISGVEKKVSASGVVIFDELTAGQYLLVQQKAAPGYSPFRPFLVRLTQSPVETLENGIDAAPKLEREKKLPQTGQLVWPAWGLAIAGIFIVFLGLFIQKRK